MAKGRRLPSVMKNRFSTVSTANISRLRSSFDRSHGYKTTFSCDWLVPIFLDEVLPGDTFSLTSTHLCRLTTLVQPIMDNLRLDLQFFYVPNRLLWDNWEDFITGGDQPVAWTGPQNPADNLYLPQTFSPETGYEEGSIYDYFGLPTKIAGSYRHCVLPLRAYNLIWNEYFRDQNLQESVHVFTGDSDPKVDPVTGEPSTADNAVAYTYTLLKRGKRYDYFTSALPALQKHFASVGIGIAGGDSGRLPVQGLALPQVSVGTSSSNIPGATLVSQNGYVPQYTFGTSTSSVTATIPTASDPQKVNDVVVNSSLTSNPLTSGSYFTASGSATGQYYVNPTVVIDGSLPIGTATLQTRSGNSTSSGAAKYVGPLNSENWPVYVDLGSASSVTINALRNAITLQQWYEKNARYGTRYIEQIQGHFGVHAQDFRLQRPEYLGGSKSYVSINPTTQTSSTDSTSPQGNLAAYALSTDSKRLFTKSFVEHGWIIGLASVTADLTYQQGLDRMWSRFSKYDFYWPTFAHLGEQPVYNKEIYCQADSVIGDGGVAVNDMPFGYQERYAEYRYKPSKITGLFRSNATGTLDSWHLSQYFDGLPTLNKTFIESNTPIDRALAVPNQPDFLADFYFSLRCVRPMPVYSVPGLRRI
ncbi:putative VP1 [Microvirus sp.]|nr:putative VP1 [Microvirus sp.]